MLSTLVTLLIVVIVAAVLLYVARLIIAGFKVEQPWANVTYALVILIVLFAALSELGLFGTPHAWRSWR